MLQFIIEALKLERVSVVSDMLSSVYRILTCKLSAGNLLLKRSLVCLNGLELGGWEDLRKLKLSKGEKN